MAIFTKTSPPKLVSKDTVQLTIYYIYKKLFSEGDIHYFLYRCILR